MCKVVHKYISISEKLDVLPNPDPKSEGFRDALIPKDMHKCKP